MGEHSFKYPESSMEISMKIAQWTMLDSLVESLDFRNRGIPFRQRRQALTPFVAALSTAKSFLGMRFQDVS